jgi:receptor expression-enhancing protein 5/6
MLPATRGAEVLYANVLRPLAKNVKAKAQGSNSTFAQKPSEGFSTAGTTAPSSFERMLTLSLAGMTQLTIRREDSLSALIE